MTLNPGPQNLQQPNVFACQALGVRSLCVAFRALGGGGWR